MTQITIQAHVYREKQYRAADPEKFNVLSFKTDMDSFGLYVGPVAIEYEVPADFNPVAVEVAQIETAKKAALDAYNESVRTLNERLHKLQAITA